MHLGDIFSLTSVHLRRPYAQSRFRHDHLFYPIEWLDGNLLAFRKFVRVIKRVFHPYSAHLFNYSTVSNWFGVQSQSFDDANSIVIDYINIWPTYRATVTNPSQLYTNRWKIDGHAREGKR